MSRTYADAISDSIVGLMERDGRVVLLGEGVADPKGVFGTCLEACKRFPKRVIETPLSETMLTGACVGMAMEGLFPLYVHARFDFALFCFEHLINSAAKLAALGRPCPMVLRCIVGRGWGQGPTHSQTFHGMLAQVPGLRMFAPATPKQYKEAIQATTRANGPVIIMEPRRLYNQTLEQWMWWSHPQVQIVTVGDTLLDALEAQSILMRVGVKANLIPCAQLGLDCLPPGPLDLPTVIVDMGVGAWGLMTTYHYPRCKVVAGSFSPTPASPEEEADWYPRPADIVAAACQLLDRPMPLDDAQVPQDKPKADMPQGGPF